MSEFAPSPIPVLFPESCGVAGNSRAEALTGARSIEKLIENQHSIVSLHSTPCIFWSARALLRFSKQLKNMADNFDYGAILNQLDYLSGDKSLSNGLYP